MAALPHCHPAASSMTQPKAKFGGTISVPTMAIIAETLSPDRLVEIEAIAAG